MAKGESRRLSYTPGEQRVRSIPPEDGDYVLNLKKFTKGRKGWKMKPGKFPSKMLVFKVQGTEDEETGEEKEIVEFCAAHPKAFWKTYDLAAASGFTEGFDGDAPSRPGDAATLGVCDFIDSVLDFISENDLNLNATLGKETYKGRENSKVQAWLPPSEEGAAPAAPAGEESGEEGELGADIPDKGIPEDAELVPDGEELGGEAEDDDAGIVPPPRKQMAKVTKLPAPAKPAVAAKKPAPAPAAVKKPLPKKVARK